MTSDEARILGVSSTKELLSMRDALYRLIGRMDEHERGRQEWHTSIEARLEKLEERLECCHDRTEEMVKEQIAACRASRVHDTEDAVRWAADKAAAERGGASLRMKIAWAVSVLVGVSGVVFALVERL